MEEKLIDLVKSYDYLYNVSSKHYMNKQMKHIAWNKIGTEMDKTGEECQKIWTKIRDNFRKALVNRRSKNGVPYTKRRPIKFERELEFLKEFIEYRRRTSNLDSSSEDTQTSCTESAVNDNEEGLVSRMPHDSYHSFITAEPTTTAEIVNKYTESKQEVNPIDSFFQTMAATTKKLPEKVQVQIKRQIFDIVTDAELNLIQGNEIPVSAPTLYIKSEDTRVSSNLRHQRPCRIKHSTGSSD